MRNAISPRFAIKTLSNSLSDLVAKQRSARKTGRHRNRRCGHRAGSRQRDSFPHLRDDEQRLSELNRLAVFGDYGLDRAACIGFDFVHQFHRLDDAKYVTLLYGVTHLDERLRARRCRPIERPDHWALDDMPFGLWRWRSRR